MAIGQDKWSLKHDLIRQLVEGQCALAAVAQQLGCSVRTIRRYRARFLSAGTEGLRDGRGGNRRILSGGEELAIVQAKRQGPHRSARWICDHLRLRVTVQTVWRVLAKHQLDRLNFPSLNPIERFEAPHPNDLWQIDIQPRLKFPHLGWLYLILISDDHSGYLLGGGWFRSKHKINVFACCYRAFKQCGLPKEILSERGSELHPTGRWGQAAFEDYMARLGICLDVARRARTKGKVERRFGFVQRDFVLEHLQERSLERLNAAWQVWVAWYNHRFHSKALRGHTASQHYRVCSRRRSQAELQVMLTYEEPGRVRFDSTINYYGRNYSVPAGYLKCPVWMKLRGNTLYIEAMGRRIAKHRMVPW